MKNFLPFLLLLTACSKQDTGTTNLVEVTYEIQTTVTGFNTLRYTEYQNATTGSTNVNWTITGVGTFTKVAKVPRNTLAEIYAMHPTSNAWKLTIYSSTGALLKESDAINFQAGSPSYYYETVSVAAQ